jgi:cytochrome P450 family 4
LVSTGEKWHARRKIITPAFHFKILEQFCEIFGRQSDTFVQNLAKFENKTVDVFPLVNLCSLDVICGNF